MVLAELANCTAALEGTGGITVSNNFSSITYTGSGTTQDVTFTLSDMAGNDLECTKSITIIGDCPIGIDCSAVSDIVVDCNDGNPLGPTLSEIIETEIANCAANLAAASSSPDGGPVTVTDNYLLLPYTGSGSNQDIIFTVTDNQGAVTECTKSLTIVGDCKFVECPPTPFLTCEDGLPEPITSFREFLAVGGTYDFLGCDTLSITSSDDDAFEDLDFCSTDKIELRRLYTLTDGCGEIFRCRRKIRYTRNTEPPVITCPAETTVNVNTADCTYQATLTPPSAASNCSLLDVVSVTSQFPNNEVDLEEGQHVIQWTAVDECGRSATCEQIINVVGDGNDFSIICNSSVTAFLEANGTANVPAGQFVNTIYDACGSSGPYVFQIRRLAPGSCASGTGSIYGPFIEVCCEDLASGYIDISVRVTDTNGNQSTCTAQVAVRDVINPSLLSCPADMYICLLYTSPSPRDQRGSRIPSSA